MPTYDYVCASCGNELEVMHSVHADGPTVCVKCGGTMKKTFAAPAVHYKGSGWARKDRSSPGKSGRVERKEDGSTTRDGGESSSGASGPSSGAEALGNGAGAKDAPAKEASPGEASGKDPD
jgi:putative FmdB family regulatory protein